MHRECADDNAFFLSFLNGPIRKTFKRLPPTAEWGRFRKYVPRMRELEEYCIPETLSLEVLSVLQSLTINNLLLPKLNTLQLGSIDNWLVPYVSLFLSPGITSIFLGFGSDCPRAMIASTVSSLWMPCPGLQNIRLRFPSRDAMITFAVSGMLLAANRNTLQKFDVNSPLTEEACEAVYTLPNLCQLSVHIERETSLPSASLPNLTELTIDCEDEGDWPRLFQGATFGKLESVTFHPRSEEIGDFLGAFERVALSSSMQNTLSRFHVSAPYPWNPNYSSLLPFTQLVNLNIGFSCEDGCASRVDDDMIIDLSRAMPKLQLLKLGYEPCRESTTGVTAKGLLALALHCPNLYYLNIHFQVAGLIAPPPAGPGISISDTETTGSWTGCALKCFVAGETEVPEESALVMAFTLLRIFPRIDSINATAQGWEEIEDAIYESSIVQVSKPPYCTFK